VAGRRFEGRKRGRHDGIPTGKGSIVLCNLKFQATEEVPVKRSKRTIMTALLRNLRAQFSGKSVIAGANLVYQPVDLSRVATQYRDDRGWFGDTQFRFRDFPTGKQTMAGVDYQVYDFPTSPVPTVVMFSGPQVPGRLPAESGDTSPSASGRPLLPHGGPNRPSTFAR
jgi:beta-galactosidase